MEPDELEAINTSSGDESAGLNTAAPGESYTPDEGGAIQTDDNSGAAPVVANGMTASPQDPEQDRTGPNGPIARNLKAFPGNAKRIISYLMGADAAPPQALQQTAQQVDPDGSMPASDRNLAAVQKTAAEQGPEAAWKLVQANRVAYNAKQAFAYAAMNGTPQKRPDLNAAIDAANQAQSHVLDGSDVQFAPAQGGVTATVKSPDGKTSQIPLSMDAFRQYLNVGRNGQFDRVMQDTVPGTLQKLAQGGQQQRPQVRPQAPKPAAAPIQAPAYGADQETNFGKTPSTQNLSGNNKVQYGSMDEPSTENASLDQRAQRQFPGITQGPQAEAWKNSEMQRGEQNQNKVDVAQTTATGKVKTEEVKQAGAGAVADTKAAAWRYASDAKQASAQIAADAKAAAQGSKDAQARIESARKMIAMKHQTAEKLTPEETALEAQINAVGLQAAQGQGQAAPPQGRGQSKPQPQAPAPQKAQSPGQPPVQGAKFYKGSWYTRGPNGESVPVQ